MAGQTGSGLPKRRFFSRKVHGLSRQKVGGLLNMKCPILRVKTELKCFSELYDVTGKYRKIQQIRIIEIIGRNGSKRLKNDF